MRRSTGTVYLPFDAASLTTHPPLVGGFVGEGGGGKGRERGAKAQTVVAGEGGHVQSARGGVGLPFDAAS